MLCYQMSMYVGKHAWYMYMCMHVYIYVLTCIFIQADMHEYVAMYICMCVGRNA